MSASGSRTRADARRDHTSRLDSGANRLAGLEERSTWEGPDRSGLDHRVNGVARHPRSSCDLFDSKDVRENGHRRSADKGKSLASSQRADSGLICRCAPALRPLSRSALSRAPSPRSDPLALQSLDEPVALAVAEGPDRSEAGGFERGHGSAGRVRTRRRAWLPPKRLRKPVWAPASSASSRPPARRTRRHSASSRSRTSRGQRRQQPSRRVNDHEVVGVVGKGQRMERADDMDVAKASGFGDGVAGGCGRRFVTNHEAGLTGHAGLGRDRRPRSPGRRARFAARVRRGARRSW